MKNETAEKCHVSIHWQAEKKTKKKNRAIKLERRRGNIDNKH